MTKEENEYDALYAKPGNDHEDEDEDGGFYGKGKHGTKGGSRPQIVAVDSNSPQNVEDDDEYEYYEEQYQSVLLLNVIEISNIMLNKQCIIEL